jgi:hypothetical protein
VKLLVEDLVFNVISAYTPQIGLNESIKRQFWEQLDAFLRYECQPQPVLKSYVCTIMSTQSKVPSVTFCGHFTFSSLFLDFIKCCMA